MAKLVSKTYGEALFELALEKQMLDTILEEINAVKEVFAGNKELVKLLNHPKISKEEKIEVIENIFKERVSEDVTGFLVIVMGKSRYNEIEEILNYFITLVKEYKKIGTAIITSATELTNEQKLRIEQKLLATTKYVKFEISYEVDASLIGGVIIRIGDRVVDGSIKAKLEHMVKDLQYIQLSGRL